MAVLTERYPLNYNLCMNSEFFDEQDVVFMNLTKPQETIWNMERFAGGAVATICTSMLRRGTQNEQSLQSVVAALYRNNDSLRIRIRMDGILPKQSVSPYSGKPVEVLRFLDQAELKAYAEKYAQEAMELSGSLCEMTIILLPDCYGLLVKAHHLVADAWTMAFLAEQFNMLIEGKQLCCGSYQNLVERDASYISSRRYLQDKQFFMNLIDPIEEPVYLCDCHTDILASDRMCFTISKKTAEEIRSFAAREEISLLSLFSQVLACYISRINANKEQVLLGTTVLNRVNEAEMRTAGMFVNTVPMRVAVRENSSFRNCLEETEDMLMSVFRHQRYNYTQLLKDAAEERSVSGRLYDVLLNFINASVESAEQETENMWYHNGIQNESLQIHVDDRNCEGIFRVTYDYQTEKFSGTEIEKLHEHLLNLLCDGICHPEKDCHTLSMLAPEEETWLLLGVNNTKKVYPVSANATISSLFEANAEQHPEKTCIYLDGKQISYGTFLQYTRYLDMEIRRHTNHRKSVIAVIAERSVEMYCALYGILRGGNAYLPILPETPRERIDYILKSSGAALVLAQTSFVDLVGNVPCVDISAEVTTIPEITTAAECAALPWDIAYVMYTSGSTGTPKGVKISHQSVINRILWMNDAYPLEDQDIILQKTVYGFDVSVWEIFWWGMCGGAMAVSLPGEHAVPARILYEVFRSKVTHLHFVPSVFELFLNYLEKNEEERDQFVTVKHVFLSGESLEADLVDRFYRLYDKRNVKLHNLYGPTECTVDVTYYDCVPGEALIPIGKPIHNTQIYIMDRYLNLLPAGIKGELVIGGQNVGMGYINEPELTNVKFVDNPFGNGKLYRTGDVAYLREDGQIIYCGRLDSQVKIHGQRIELGEIETVIRDLSFVDNVVVMLRKEYGRETLVAYYSSCEPDDGALRAACQNRLPHYMVPHPVWVQQFPLHPNGKLNRKRLVEIPLEHVEKEQLEMPVNALERQICDAFCRVLKLESVGRNSDFFALGGDSLAALSLLSEHDYDQITAVQFIGNPTPAKLAALIMGNRQEGMKYVQIIHKPEICKRAYVLFPYAGGTAESFGKLVSAVMNQDDSVALYYVPYLHSVFECNEAAEEIVKLAGVSDVCFYSHCAGAAVALCILHHIEESYGCLISHYYAAGMVPFRTFFTCNGWNHVPDCSLLQLLKKAGAREGMFSGQETAERLKHFRQDTDFAAEYFARKPRKIHCSTTVLLGDGDEFTKYLVHPERQWRKYVFNLESVCVINTQSHYFHSEENELVAKLIMSK